MDDSLVEQVWRRAGGSCEYCCFFQDDYPIPFVIDHITACQHGGQHVLTNLALSCLHCNRFKGSDIASRDPRSGELVPLFNPRVESWGEHFAIDGGAILALTATGRATERLLKFNLAERVEVRETLSQAGRYPSVR